MTVQRAYSFCDAMELAAEPAKEIYSRVYIGSSFCDQYLLRVSSSLWERALRHANNRGMKLTLVIPIAAQSHLQEMKDKLNQLIPFFSDALDEAVVNDFAMLGWIRKNYPALSVWCGRLLVKDTRDPRYAADACECKILDHLKSGELYGCPVTGVELDLFAPILANELPPVTLGLHHPYGYLSTGRLCEIGSVGKDVKNKFCLTSSCSGQCSQTWIRYEANGIEMLKYGRAIYSRTDIHFMIGKMPAQADVRIIDDGFAERISGKHPSLI